MRTALMLAAIAASTSIGIGAALAQSEPELALNNPDKLAWVLFLKVNAEAKSADNNNALFETWASDGDTFQMTPAWPTTAGRLSPRAARAESRGAPAASGGPARAAAGGAGRRRHGGDTQELSGLQIHRREQPVQGFRTQGSLRFWQDVELSHQLAGDQGRTGWR